MTRAQSDEQQTQARPQSNKGGRPANRPIRPDVLRDARARLGLSRPALARRMAAAGRPVAQNTIATWEGGQHSPSEPLLVALCATLGLEVRDLLLAEAGL